MPFIDLFAELFIEQTTPIEIVVFLTIVIAGCSLLALCFYIALAGCVWFLRLRGKVPFHRVVLPTWAQLREYAGEYALAFSTASVLTATLVAKHDLVQRIAAFQLSDMDPVELGGAFPLHTPPGELVAFAAGAVSETMLQPLIAAGGSAEARFLVEQAIMPQLERSGLAMWLTPSALVAVASALILLYVGWMTWRRLRLLEKVPDAPISLGRTIGAVITLATCVALLLASPTLLDEENLVDSSVAVAASKAKTDSGNPEVLAAIQNQRRLFGQLQRVPVLADEIEAAIGRVRAMESTVAGLPAGATEEPTWMAENRRLVAALSMRVDRLETQDRQLALTLRELQKQIDACCSKSFGLLVVRTSPDTSYSIRPAIARRGEVVAPQGRTNTIGPGTHGLQPGDYLVQVRQVDQPVTIKAGEITELVLR